MQTSKPTNVKWEGFTLMELLLVLLIIGILTTVTALATRHVKNRSQDLTCVNNLRQIGMALKMYQDENHGRFPLRISIKGTTGTPPQTLETTSEWWFFDNALGGKDPIPGSKHLPPAVSRPLYPYLKPSPVFHCPTDNGWETTKSNISIRIPSLWDNSGCSYSYNAAGRVSSLSELGTTKLANKSGDNNENPSAYVLLYEMPIRTLPGRPLVVWHHSRRQASITLDEYFSNGRTLVSPFLFLDGHSAVLTFDKQHLPVPPTLLWQ